ELQRLRRLPENRVCPNCLKEDRVGFGAVCMAFKTFICDVCKSSHQSFSHRTKSVQMSVWTMEEVKSLDESNGGGNAVANRHYLANVPEGDRPTQASSLEAYKKFVDRAYIEQRWIFVPVEASTTQNSPGTASATTPDSHGSRSSTERRKSHRRKDQVEGETEGRSKSRSGKSRSHRRRSPQAEDAAAQQEVFYSADASGADAFGFGDAFGFSQAEAWQLSVESGGSSQPQEAAAAGTGRFGSELRCGANPW
ncbi:unnamed protein product, partial [Polarella glacialis]